MRYTLDGKPLQIIDEHGEYSDTGCEEIGAVCPRSAGPFNFITEMVPHPSGDLHISDGYRNARVHRFSKECTKVPSWGDPGKGGPNEFHLPHSLIVGQDGRIYRCDRENSRIQVFSAEGECSSPESASGKQPKADAQGNSRRDGFSPMVATLLPGSGADFPGRGPGEALRLRPASPSPADR